MVCKSARQKQRQVKVEEIEIQLQWIAEEEEYVMKWITFAGLRGFGITRKLRNNNDKKGKLHWCEQSFFIKYAGAIII